MVAVVGPTAVGKSDLAVRLARELAGEVVNADSMQLYRGMDVGTAKLSGAERAGVPHHLLDVLDVTETASVAAYQRQAREVMDGLRAVGRPPVLVGGSGLYVRAALDEMEFPGTDPAVRSRLEEELRRTGPGPLHDRLAELDSRAAEGILPSNGRRVVRALEVMEITGRRFSATLPEHRSYYPTVWLGLRMPRPQLDARIERRVRQMWRDGLVEEVSALQRRRIREGRTASRALGYQQVLAYLAGECTEQQAYDATVRATRRFARRQESWFRRDPRVHVLDVGEGDDDGDVDDTAGTRSSTLDELTGLALQLLHQLPGQGHENPRGVG